MADPDFKPKKGRTKKSSAIAVCHTSIMGKKTNKNMKTDIKKKKLTTAARKKIPSGKFAYIDSKGGKHLPIHDKAHVRNAMARFNQTHFESPEKKRSAARKILAAARRMGIEIDPKSGISRTGKKVTKRKNLSTRKEVKRKVSKKIVKKVKKSKKVVKKAKKVKKVKKTKNTDNLTKLLETTIEKIDKLLVKSEEKPVKEPVKEKSAPAEGVTPKKEKAPEGGEKKTPKEEVKAEPESEKADISSEGAEALNKVNSSLGKLADKMEKFGDKFAKVEERLDKLEEQPAPSKVVSQYLVSKGGTVGEASEVDTARLKKINKKLEKYEQIRDTNLERYQRESMWEKAFDLLYEKEDIIARNPSLK